MAANMTISKVGTFGDELTNGVMRKENAELYDSRMPRMYPIHRHINIFSVARRDFEKRHVYFNGTLKGCTNGERYVLCYRVPDPPQQIAVDPERGGKRVEVEPRDEAGWRVAIDILNPNNPSTNPYLKLTGKQAAMYATGENVNLIKYGLFPSLNEVPTEEELRRAEGTRDEEYLRLVDEAFEVRATNPEGFRTWLRANPDVNIAMEATGTEADWFKKAEIKQSCPNCGDSIKSGIAFHRSSAGVLCILDPEKAAKAGVYAAARPQHDEDGLDDVSGEEQDWQQQPQKRKAGRPRKHPLPVQEPLA